MDKKTKTPKTPKTKTPKTANVLDTLVAFVRTLTVANVLASIAKHNAGYTTATRNVGRHTNARIVAFQNMTLVHNAEWQLNDLQLAALWSIEFPAAVGRVFAMNALPGVRPLPSASSITDAIGIVRGVRSDYNRTGHGDPNGKPKTESVSYGDKRFAVTGTVETPEPKTAKTKTAKTA